MTLKVSFTKALLETIELPQEGKRITLLDSKTPGLQCRISHTGTITFCVYRRVGGSDPERITIGKYPQTTIEQARINAAKINAAIASGENPAEIKRAHKAELTFEQLFNDYLEIHAKPKNRSWPDDECRFRLHLKDQIGKKRISKVSKADIENIHRKLSFRKRIIVKKGKNIEKQNSAATANRVLTLVSTVYNWGIKNGQCTENPAKGVQKNIEKSRDRFLQPEELAKFFDAVNHEENASVRDFVFMSLYTGARKSNVLAMRWSEISLQHRIWRIPHTKNGDSVILPLIEEAAEILKSRINNGSDFVFPSDSKKGHMIDPKKGWARILERSQINDLRLHDLRRTLGSWQAIMGSSTLIIGKSLGHKSQKATEIYARLNIDPVRKSIESATQAMKAAGLTANNINTPNY